jgi:uncharacterized membrane-anchored protein YhcB (DUF1043 family)
MLVSYSLILLLGIMVGALGVHFFSLNGRLQKRERWLLKQRQEQLDHCYSELDSHFSRNITILEKLTSEYRLLHQQALSPPPRLPDRLLYQHTLGGGAIIEQEHDLVKAEPPCDYSSTASDLLRPKQA